jgi:hypothetical protein
MMRNRVFENFAGEYITILLNKDTKQTIEIDGRLQIIQSPALIQGYLIDEDDEYYYIGHNESSFNQVVNKRYIVHIELGNSETEEEQQDLELLDSLVDVPDEDTGIN